MCSCASDKKKIASQPHLLAHATFSLVDLNIEANVPKDWGITSKEISKGFHTDF